jgi:hypothetical protein
MVSATGSLVQAVGWSIATATEILIGAAASVGSQVLIKATPSIVRTVAHNAFDNKFYGTYRDLFEGAGQAFVSDAIYGTFSGGVSTARYYLFKGPPELKSNWMGVSTTVGSATCTVAGHEDLAHREYS